MFFFSLTSTVRIERELFFFQKDNEIIVQRISSFQYNSVYYPICDFKVELNKIDPL